MTSLATARAGDRPALETQPACGRALSDRDRLVRFTAAYPGYFRTPRLDRLRSSEYAYLDDRRQIYLDYTGAGLPARAQLAEHTARIAANCFGNPHSENPASVASTDLIESARQAILDYFSAPTGEYAVIFTQNASAACRLVGEAYPFSPRRGLVLTSDNHNSVNGIREFASARGAGTRYVPFAQRPPQAARSDLRIAASDVHAALQAGRRGHAGPGLFAFPAQSNFSGVRHDLGWIAAAHEHGYEVLLDAAAYVPTARLDLSVVKPDFVPVSWYKVFGYPTGVGCLIARRSALATLQRPWFAGGTITAASVQVGWHALADDETRFEDGTPNFLQVPDVTFGLNWINSIGIDVIGERVTCLTGWMISELTAIRHRNGQPVVAIHGPAGTAGRGGTVAFNVLDPEGEVVDADAVARRAAAANISIRTGCFCNPGAAEAAFGLSEPDIVAAWQRAGGQGGAYPAATGFGGGAIRASVGLVSTINDVEAFLALIETMRR